MFNNNLQNIWNITMGILSKLFPKKIERLSFPQKLGTTICFKVEGRDFTYKVRRCENKISYNLVGGSSGNDELWVGIHNTDHKTWAVRLNVNGGTADVANCEYYVKYFEDLPLELFNFVSRLSRLCWEELEEQPKRWEREREEEKVRALNQLIGANGMLSPNPLIRSLAQKAK